jgi:hypothetical protein
MLVMKKLTPTGTIVKMITKPIKNICVTYAPFVVSISPLAFAQLHLQAHQQWLETQEGKKYWEKALECKSSLLKTRKDPQVHTYVPYLA